jgi:hypothetical protein
MYVVTVVSLTTANMFICLFIVSLKIYSYSNEKHEFYFAIILKVRARLSVHGNERQ